MLYYILIIELNILTNGGFNLEKLVVTGGTPLKGEVSIVGAKNSAVAILPATLLLKGVCTLENVPNISDINII